MSTSHLFEASLAALLLAGCDEEDVPATAQAREQWSKSMAKHTLQTRAEESPPEDGEG